MSSTRTKITVFLFGVFIALLALTVANALRADSAGLITSSASAGQLQPAQTNPEQPQNTGRDKPSPEDYFTEDMIQVYRDRVILNAANLQWASFEDTKSMLPVINKDSNALQRIPKSPNEIKVGDIVSYKSEYSDSIIIHRVVFIGQDDEGLYYILKGDNNPASDPGKVRFSQIQRVVVAIIY